MSMNQETRPTESSTDHTDARVETKLSSRERPGIDFPMVGLGASAGGQEAFQHFLDVMPSDSGMAFVLIQHLDPEHGAS